LWLDGEGDTPGKFQTASSAQRASQITAGTRRGTKRLSTTSRLMGRYIAGSQPKTVLALPVPIADQIRDREYRRRGSGLVCADGKQMKRLLAGESRFGPSMERRSGRCCWGLKGSVTSRREEKGRFTYRGDSGNDRPHVRRLRSPQG
jgi:hypothetical protein